MKKLISMLLAVTMIVGMLCLGVSAADDLVGTVNSGTANDSTEGSATLEQIAGSGVYDVVFTISGDTAPRYAVDVEASHLTYTFSTNLVWDVNALDYVAVDTTAVNAPDAPTFVVSNRSNMPVKITLTDSESAAANAAGIALSFAKASMTLSATAPKAAVPVSETFTGTWSCTGDDWAAAFGVLKGYADTTTNQVIIATVTVTVSAPTP